MTARDLPDSSTPSCEDLFYTTPQLALSEKVCVSCASRMSSEILRCLQGIITPDPHPSIGVLRLLKLLLSRVKTRMAPAAVVSSQADPTFDNYSVALRVRQQTETAQSRSLVHPTTTHLMPDFWLAGMEAEGAGVDVHPVTRASGTCRVPRVSVGNSCWS